MTIKWTADGKVDRYLWRIASLTECRAQRDRVADALDEAVAALRWYAEPIAYSIPVKDMNHHVFPDMGTKARKTLRRLGVRYD